MYNSLTGTLQMHACRIKKLIFFERFGELFFTQDKNYYSFLHMSCKKKKKKKNERETTPQDDGMEKKYPTLQSAQDYQTFYS